MPRIQQASSSKKGGSYRGGYSRGAALIPHNQHHHSNSNSTSSVTTTTATAAENNNNPIPSSKPTIDAMIIASPPPLHSRYSKANALKEDHTTSLLPVTPSPDHERVFNLESSSSSSLSTTPVSEVLNGSCIVSQSSNEDCDNDHNVNDSPLFAKKRNSPTKVQENVPKRLNATDSVCTTMARSRVRRRRKTNQTQEELEQFGLLHFEHCHESTLRLLRTGAGQSDDYGNIYAPDFMEGYENVISSLDIVETEFEHPKEFIGTSSRIKLDSERKPFELMIYNDVSYLTISSRNRVWWRDDIPNKSLCSYRIIESRGKSSPRTKLSSMETYNAIRQTIGCDERAWYAFPAICREAHLLLTLRRRLIESKCERMIVVPDRILMGKREVSLQLNTELYRVSTANQFLTFAIATGGMDLDKQRTMADLIYQIILAIRDCHSCGIVHGSLDLNCILLKEKSSTTCSVSLIGFHKNGVDCSKSDENHRLYTADNHALANMIYLLLTGNQLCSSWTSDDIVLSQYTIGKPTYEAILRELLRPECSALHINDDLQCFLNILSTLRPESDEVVPELIEQPYIVENKRRRRSESIFSEEEFFENKLNGNNLNDEARSLINDLQNESSLTS